MHKTVSKDSSKLIHELIALSLYLQLSDMRTERTFGNQDFVDISSTVSIRSVNVVQMNVSTSPEAQLARSRATPTQDLGYFLLAETSRRE